MEPFTLVSAELPTLGEKENQSRTDALAANFALRQVEAQPARGIYQGAAEQSFLVPGAEGSVEWETVIDMARLFDQASVLHVDVYGQAALYDAKGQYIKEAGRWHEIKGVTQIGQQTFTAD